MPKDNLFDEKELIQLIAKDDQLAFRKLYDHYRNRVYSVAYKLTRSSNTANEIVEDVFLKIWLRRTDLFKIHDFSAYLFIITRNDTYKVLKRIAKNYKFTLINDDDQTLAHNDTEEQLIYKDYREILDGVVGQLPKQQKLVFKLIKEEGFRREEVARLLNLSPETVKFHLSQAVKKVRFFCQSNIDLFGVFMVFFSHPDF